MIDILSSLGFGIKTGKELDVTVPTFRPDVTREIDLIEEVARIYGLDRIKTSMTGGGPLVTEERPEDHFSRLLKDLLRSAGCVEALTNTLIDPIKDEVISDLDNHVRVLKPVSAELCALRQNLVLSFLNIISYNLNRRKSDISFFELGKVFIPDGPQLPVEKTRLAIAVCGTESVVNWDRRSFDYDFFDLKGVLGSLAGELRVGELKLEPKEHIFFEKTVSFDLLLSSEPCGFCGEVAGRARELFDIEIPVFYAEVDFDALLARFSEERKFVPVPRYPSSIRDMALVVDRGVFADSLRSEIVSAGGDLVSRVVLFDVYEGKQVPAGKKSLAFSIEYRSKDKTLTDEEIEEVHGKILSRVSDKFSAELRS
jgi:phenylalanyl-tRNA synthetase beta chain